jgi:GT2 family glycosyltransferase/SAM-dependent methyltransferase
MDFTGERFVPSERGKIRYEHLHRYALSLEFVAGKSVLDIASGEGYGSAILAATASSVTGVDHDVRSVEHARRQYPDPALEFVVGSCDAVPFPDAQFEVVTSFETVEHHDKHEEMLGEIRRTLKPGGVLVISSPNRLIYTDNRGYVNPFHVKELYLDEFRDLLLRHFEHVCIYGQKLAAGSFVYPLNESRETNLGALTGDGNQVSGHVLSLPSPTYFVALCSDSGEIEERSFGSVYLERAGDLLEVLESEQEDQLDRMRDQVRSIEAEVGRQKSEYETLLNRQTTDMTEARAGYEEQIHSQEDALNVVQEHNQQLTASVQQLTSSVVEANEQLKMVHGLLSDAGKQQSALEEALASQEVVVRSQAEVISGQSATIASQMSAILRQTQVLDWIYASRAWRIASNVGKVEDLGQRWYRFRNRIRSLLSGPRPEIFDGIVDCARVDLEGAGSLELWGWVHSGAGRVTFVEAFLDDIYLGRLRYGVRRTDVVAVHPQAPLECGYDDRIPMSGFRFEGKKNIRIRVYDERGNKQIFRVTIPTEPGVATHPETIDPQAPQPSERPGFDAQAKVDVGRDAEVEVPVELVHAVAEFQDRMERDPSVLDWDSGLDLASRLPHLAVFSPPPTADSGRVLPYLDHSVDIVVTASVDPGALDHARRVADSALIRTGYQENADKVDEKDDEPWLSVEWHEDRIDELSTPTISIVIPVYNELTYTEDCLRQLDRTLPRGFRGEIIVVDDASTDETPSMLKRLARDDDRIRVLSNSDNCGFIKSCNAGAASASGDVLVFLNNDTLPMDGWLTPLLRVLEEQPDAGAVTGKLIYPDRTLQEAGGVVFSDGSACNFGKGDRAASAPLYNYLREVDYGSGALLATPRAIFNEVGGFDLRFEPAYYEDVDYCFTLRARGYRVYYQPESVVVHFEGATSGTDLKTGVKSYQVSNHRKFVEKWSEQLRHQPHAPAQYDLATMHALAARHQEGSGHGH